MKVCVISSIFPPYTRGGAETVAHASARAFSEQDDVFVITCAPFKDFANFAGKWHQEDKLRVFRFTPLNLFSIFNISKYPRLLRLIWHMIDILNFHSYLVIRKVLLKEKPDLILTHNLKGIGYTTHLAIHHSDFVKRKAKWIHTIHDMAFLHPTGLRIFGSEHSILQENILVRLYAWMNKKLIGSPSVVVSPSKFLLDEHLRKGFFRNSKTYVIQNPVDADVSIKHGNEQVFRFLYLGQLESYKGLRDIINAWKQFSADNSNAELIIAGRGSMEKEIQREVGHLARVKYIGWVDNNKLGDLFAKVNATLLPSLAYENSPTTIGESISHGVPVIASRIGGIPELIEDGVSGILVKPGDVEDLIDAMKRIASIDRKEMFKNVQKYAKNFTLKKYKESLLNTIK